MDKVFANGVPSGKFLFLKNPYELVYLKNGELQI